MAQTFERCSFSYNGAVCGKKVECHICHQCGDGGHGGHCPGHVGVDEYYLKTPEKKADEKLTKTAKAVLVVIKQSQA
jgi:hypothetical protein